MTVISYVQKPKSVYDDSNLWRQKDAPEVLTILADRMKISYLNGEKWFDADKDWQDYYVWYPQKKMAQKIHASDKKIFNIYKFLEQEDYIRRQTLGDKKPDEIFLMPLSKAMFPALSKYYESGLVKNTGRDSQKLRRIKNEQNNNYVHHSCGSSNSVNSVDEKSENTSSPRKPQSQIDTESNVDNKSNDTSSKASNLASLHSSRLQHWITKTHYGLGLSTNVLKNVLVVANYSTSVAKHVIKIIKDAKTAVTRKHHIGFMDERARFESNANLDLPLADKVLYIFNYIKQHKLTGKSQKKYAMSCFKDFLLDGLGIKAQQTNLQAQPDMVDDDDQMFNDDIDNSNLSHDDNDDNQGKPNFFDRLKASYGGKLPKLSEL